MTGKACTAFIFLFVFSAHLASIAQIPPWPWETPLPKASESTGRQDSVPDVSSHGVVKEGDTIAAILRRYGLTLSELVRLNPRLDFSNLKPGEPIILVDTEMKKIITPFQQALSRLEQMRAENEAKQRAFYSCDPRLSVSQNAISFLYSGYAVLRQKISGRSNDECYDSQVRLFCFNGSCGVYFDSGKYGYHPLKCNAVRISQRIWKWCGNQPSTIATEMWNYLGDGVEVATNLSKWPDGFTNSREFPLHIKRAKILSYNASLGLASAP